MMCDARIFLPQITAFNASRLVIIGCMADTDDFTTFARNMLDHAPPQFVLVGLSMGGIAAMEIMRLAPERVSKLALLDTNPLADTPEKSRERDEQMRRVKNGALREVMRNNLKPHYLANRSQKNVISSLCMDMAETLGPKVFVNQSRALQFRKDQCNTLRKISVSTLIMCGAEDSLCPPARHEFMHKLIPESRLSIIEGAGHLPTLEQVERTNQEMKQWLKS